MQLNALPLLMHQTHMSLSKCQNNKMCFVIRLEGILGLGLKVSQKKNKKRKDVFYTQDIHVFFYSLLFLFFNQSSNMYPKPKALNDKKKPNYLSIVLCQKYIQGSKLTASVGGPLGDANQFI